MSEGISFKAPVDIFAILSGFGRVRTHLGDSFLITIISPFAIVPVEKVSFLSISSTGTGLTIKGMRISSTFTFPCMTTVFVF
jgi:hypothetical protein